MKSGERSDSLDLDRDLPTTPEDVEALRRVRSLAPIDFEAYLRFLEQVPAPSIGSLRLKRGPRGDDPFELP